MSVLMVATSPTPIAQAKSPLTTVTVLWHGSDPIDGKALVLIRVVRLVVQTGGRVGIRDQELPALFLGRCLGITVPTEELLKASRLVRYSDNLAGSYQKADSRTIGVELGTLIWQVNRELDNELAGGPETTKRYHHRQGPSRPTSCWRYQTSLDRLASWFA